MMKSKKTMSIDKAKTIVRKAMGVIVGFMVGDLPCSESYQRLYDKVHAVTDEVIKALGTADFNDDKSAIELYGLAKNIKAWDEDHMSFLCSDPCPEKWMFKTIK